MRKKDILVKSKYNRISVAFVREGKYDNKAELRIWVTKGRCKPVYDETKIFNLVSDDPDKFTNEINELLKMLKEEYFDKFDDQLRQRKKQNEYQRKYTAKAEVKEKLKAKRRSENNKAKHRADNAKYYSKIKPTYLGRRDWEPEEDNYIKNNLDKSLTEMAKHLGRSISSVSQRKHKIVNGLLYMK